MEFGAVQKGMMDVNQWFCGLFGQFTKGRAGEAANPGPALDMGKAKDASAGLGKLESNQGKIEGTKLQTREDVEKTNQFEVEKAKLKNQQLGESKKVYASQEDKKADFKKQQEWELAHFEASHKGDKDIVAKRMKFIDQQAAARGKFENSLKAENVALYKKHKSEEAALEAKYHPKPKAVVGGEIPTYSSTKTVKTVNGKTIIETSTMKPLSGKGPQPATDTKSDKVVEIAPQICGPDLACKPLPEHDGVKDDLVFIAPLGPKMV